MKPVPARRPGSRWRAAAFAAGLVLAATPAGGRAATVAEHLEALRVQIPNELVVAPEFSLEGLDGRPVSLKSFRGKVVFLNFWATWCVPCRAEMPAMERLHREYGTRGLAMVAVNFQESKAEAQTFADEFRLTFLILLDPKGTVTRSYAVRALPVTYLVDRDGKILWKAAGRRVWDGPHGRAYFERVLAAGGPR